MTKRQTERAVHEFAGQEDGTSLAEWLNMEEPHRVGATRSEIQADRRMSKRIAWLIEAINESAENHLKHGRVNPELRERIDTELARHALRVKTIEVQNTGRGKTHTEARWTFGWYSNRGSRSAEMIFRIVRLGERGLLARVRRCSRDRCGRWFFAKFNHQLFCSSRCQVLHYQTSEEWKARRRERYRER